MIALYRTVAGHTVNSNIMNRLRHHFETESREIMLTATKSQRLAIIIDNIEVPSETVCVQLRSIEKHTNMNLTKDEFETVHRNKQKIIDFMAKKTKMARKFNILSVNKLKIYVGEMHGSIGIFLKKNNVEIRYQKTTFLMMFNVKHFFIKQIYNEIVKKVRNNAAKMICNCQLIFIREEFVQYEDAKTKLLSTLNELKNLPML